MIQIYKMKISVFSRIKGLLILLLILNLVTESQAQDSVSSIWKNDSKSISMESELGKFTHENKKQETTIKNIKKRGNFNEIPEKALDKHESKEISDTDSQNDSENHGQQNDFKNDQNKADSNISFELAYIENGNQSSIALDQAGTIEAQKNSTRYKFSSIPFQAFRGKGISFAERNLISDLLDGYNKHIRPVKRADDITYIYVDLTIFDVLKLDTLHQTLRTNAEFSMKWVDIYLQWEPEDYDGITVIRIPHDKIWYPDVILYNTAESDYEAGMILTNAILNFNGEIELVVHAIYNSICNVDIQWYPFDQQDCTYVFASWTYDMMGIQLIRGPADISNYHQNPEYYLEDFYGEQKMLFNPCCRKPMSTVIYHIQLQRRSKFSFFFYLMPGILINLCAVMVFSLPAESGEKIGLGINSMLAMIVFLMAMTEKLPPTEKIPLAGLYYGVCIGAIACNIVLSVFVLNIYIRGERQTEVGRWIRYLTLFVNKLTKLTIPNDVQDTWNVDECGNSKKGQILVKAFKDRKSLEQITRQAITKQRNNIENGKNGFEDLKDNFERRAIMALENMANLSRQQELRNYIEEDKENLSSQWRFVSRVIDRYLFITFCLALLFFNVFFLLSSPTSEEFVYCPIGEKKCDGMTEQQIRNLSKGLARI